MARAEQWGRTVSYWLCDLFRDSIPCEKFILLWKLAFANVTIFVMSPSEIICHIIEPVKIRFLWIIPKIMLILCILNLNLLQITYHLLLNKSSFCFSFALGYCLSTWLYPYLLPGISRLNSANEKNLHDIWKVT
jgi:hypothetical protein